MRRGAAILLLGVALACGAPDDESAPDVLDALREQAATPEQRALLERLTPADVEPLLGGAPGEDGVVQRAPRLAADVALPPVEPAPVEAGAPTRVALDLGGAGPFEGRARVVRVGGDSVWLDAGGNEVRIRAALAGRALAVAEGENVRLTVRAGTPERRRDILELRAAGDALGYALVGARGPVVVELRRFELRASQLAGGRGNRAPVQVGVGRETRVIEEFGVPVLFEEAGVRVEVLASVAADEAAARVLPESHRLELVVWSEKPVAPREPPEPANER